MSNKDNDFVDYSKSNRQPANRSASAGKTTKKTSAVNPKTSAETKPNIMEEQTNSESKEAINTQTEKTNTALKKAIVIRCPSLNIREEPNPESEILEEILCGDELYIDPSRSTRHYFGVKLEDGIEGYCIKQFLQNK